MTTRYDVLTIGETMLRLTPPNFSRIEQANSFAMEVGGSESNTAVGLARLGLKTAWLSRLPDNALGRLVARTVGQHGVDVGHVHFAGDSRLGLYFFEEGLAPRNSRVIYDRQHSAFSQIQPADLPAALFTPAVARHLHVTGITPALSQSAAATVERAVGWAENAGWTISFDLNYRRALWSPPEAMAACDPLIHAADIFIAPLRDTYEVLGFPRENGAEQVLYKLAERYPQTIIVLTLSADGTIAYQPDGGQVLRQTAVPVDGNIGRIGGGDAFTAGFLYGFLTSEQHENRLRESLRWGVATAALKYTIPGDMPLIEKEEVEQIVTHLAGNDFSSELWR